VARAATVEQATTSLTSLAAHQHSSQAAVLVAVTRQVARQEVAQAATAAQVRQTVATQHQLPTVQAAVAATVRAVRVLTVLPTFVVESQVLL